MRTQALPLKTTWAEWKREDGYIWYLDIQSGAIHKVKEPLKKEGKYAAK